MFVVHKFSDQLLAPAVESNNLQKYIAHQVFHKYLFKLSELGYCVSIINVDLLRNVIMRETASTMVQILVQAMFIQLKEGSYIEGNVVEMNQQGIQIEFFGCLRGMIDQADIDYGTSFKEKTSQWIYVTGDKTGYQWILGNKVRAKILSLNRTKGETEMTNIIKLRANQIGLGPVEWWK